MMDEAPMPYGRMRLRVSPCERRNPHDYRTRIPSRLGRATVEEWIWKDGEFHFLLQADPSDPKAVADGVRLAELLALILDAEY
jgi:hypothetical protein